MQRPPKASGSSTLIGALVALGILAACLALYAHEFALGPASPPKASDLRSMAANEGIWRATRWLVGLGALQFVVGIGGLAIFVRTLRETRDATVLRGCSPWHL